MTHLFKSRPGWGLPSARYARLGQAPSGFTEGMLHYLGQVPWWVFSLGTAMVSASVAICLLWPLDRIRLVAVMAVMVGVFSLLRQMDPSYRYINYAKAILVPWIISRVIPIGEYQLSVLGILHVQTTNSATGSWVPDICVVAFACACLVLDFLTRDGRSLLDSLVEGGRRGGSQEIRSSGGVNIQAQGLHHSPINVVVPCTDIDSQLERVRGYLNNNNLMPAGEEARRIYRNHSHELNSQQSLRLNSYLGHVCEHEGEDAAARVHFKKAKDARPNSPEGLAYGSLALLKEGRLTDAHAMAASALKIDPSLKVAAVVFVRSCGLEMSAADCENTLDSAVVGNEDVLRSLGEIAEIRGEYCVSEAYYRRALSADTDSAVIKYKLGTSLVKQVHSWCQNNLSIKIDDVRRKALGEAGVLLSSALGGHLPDEVRPCALRARGMCSHLLGKGGDAERDLRDAYDLNSRDSQSALALAAFCLDQKQASNAVEVLENHGLETASLDLAMVYARSVCEAKDAPKYEAALKGLKSQCSNVGEMSQTEQDEALACLALLECRLNGVDAAARYLDSCGVDDTSRASSHAIVGALYLQFGRNKEASGRATESLASLVSSTPDEHRTRLVSLLIKLERYRDSIDVFDTIATKHLLDDTARNVLVGAYRCGEQGWLLARCEGIRLAGFWDSQAVELELETLRVRHEPDAAKKLVNAFADHSADTEAVKRARLRLSLVGLEMHRDDLIEGDVERLPDPMLLPVTEARILLAALRQAGQLSKARSIAYALVRRDYDSEQAHLALIDLVGIGDSGAPVGTLSEVVVGSAVKLQMKDDLTEKWIVIEDGDRPDAARNEFPPSHPLVQCILGKQVGESFVDGRNRFQERDGEILEVLDKFRYRATDSFLQWWDMFPHAPFVTPFMAVRDGDQKSVLLPMISVMTEQDRIAGEYDKWYSDNVVSPQMFAVVVNKSSVEVMARLLQSPSLPIRCCVGDRSEVIASLSSAKSAALVLGPTALVVLFFSKVFLAIVRFPFRAMVCESSVVEFLSYAKQVRSRGDLSVTVVDGELRCVGHSEVQRSGFAAEIEKFVAWVRANCEIKGGACLGFVDTVVRAELVSLVGESGAESIALAWREGVPLWSDDLCAAVVAKESLSVSRTWSQIVIENVADRIDLSGRTLPDLWCSCLGVE